jgi:hypothetical protein
LLCDDPQGHLQLVHKQAQVHSNAAVLCWGPNCLIIERSLIPQPSSSHIAKALQCQPGLHVCTA